MSIPELLSERLDHFRTTRSGYQSFIKPDWNRFIVDVHLEEKP